MIKNTALIPDFVSNKLTQFIHSALQEDIGLGDYSSLACISPNHTSKAKLFIKDDCVLSGVSFAQALIQEMDNTMQIQLYKQDGDICHKGEIAFELQGATHTLLKAERLLLNVMQRMSGIATRTAQLTQLISHTDCKLLDTRKTTPLIRFLEKWAVTIGGGYNHRFGLYDMIMLKDNHIDASGGITNALNNTFAYLKMNNLDIPIEVETRTLKDVEEVMIIGNIQRIMFDNFTPNTIKEALKIVQGKYETEASGGITAETIISYAETGVNFISIGQLTHSVQSIDLSLKIVD